MQNTSSESNSMSRGGHSFNWCPSMQHNSHKELINTNPYMSKWNICKKKICSSKLKYTGWHTLARTSFQQVILQKKISLPDKPNNLQKERPVDNQAEAGNDKVTP